MLRKLNWHAFGDEGFILLGYQKKQILSPMLLNESFLLVRNLFPFLSDDPIIELRIISLALTILSVCLFCLASYQWLKNIFYCKFNKTIFIGLFLISGLICQPWPPTLHYNSIQLILYLIVLSFFLLSISQESYLSLIYAFLCGYFLVFSIFNYLSSGLLLFLTVLLLGFLLIKKKAKNYYIFLFLGIFAGFILYHFLIHNLGSYFSDLILSLNNQESTHSPILIFKNLFGFILTLILIYFPIIILYIVFRQLFINYRSVFTMYIVPSLISGIFIYLKFTTLTFKSNLWIVPFIMFLIIYFVIAFKYKLLLNKFLYILLFVFLIIWSYKYSGNFGMYLLFVPWGLVLTDTILNNKNILTSPKILLILIFASIPILGEFGTNLTLDKKLGMFSPVYALLLFILLQWNSLNSKSSRYISYILLFLIINLSLHYHEGFYCLKKGYLDYQLKSGKIQNAGREKNIIFSEYDKERYEDIINILKRNGFHNGDKILSNGVDYAIVYIAGGLSAQPFTYGQGQFNDNVHRDSIPAFIIIPESEDTILQKYVKRHFDIEISEEYNFYPMRSYLEWDNGEHKISIYCKKMQ